MDLDNKLNETDEDDVSLDDASESSDADSTSQLDGSDASASVDSEPGPYELAAAGLVQPYQFEPAADSGSSSKDDEKVESGKEEYLQDLSLWLVVYLLVLSPVAIYMLNFSKMRRGSKMLICSIFILKYYRHWVTSSKFKLLASGQSDDCTE